MKNFIFTLTLLTAIVIAAQKTNAQNSNVGIGTTTPNASAMLDVVSTAKGVLVPRLTTLQMNAIPAPANGLMVYNTDSSCFFFYKTAATSWMSLCTSGVSGPSQTAWWIAGNAGINATTDFLGTTTAADLVRKTNSIERMRTTSSGHTVVNSTTPLAVDVFSVYGTGAPGAISPLGTNAISGYVSGTGTGIFGNNQGTGTGITGVSASGTGVFGQGSGTAVLGVSGRNLDVAGTGVLATGNGIASGIVLTGGTGLAANGTTAGIFVTASAVPNGTGILAVGNGIVGSNSLTTGSGVAGTGFLTGVYGLSSSTTASTDRSGGYFQTSAGGSFSYVGMLDNTNIARKIAGNGVVSTIVKDLNGKFVYMACPEAPENLFEDYGKGVLVNGTAHITLDPILSKNIVVNDQHELRVFIQLEGDCKGVFVSNKTQNGFDVTELQGGKSNVKFSWHIVANRADEILPDGTLSQYSSGRFTPASGPMENVSQKTVKIEFPKVKDNK